ncbi:hypothetical protein [Lunatibacter salilacus]|uniref:hypothetical protein n=1 Tax=Lunatibacter salilacus TaxID=2483804 RepID=UPI00131B2B91|nr:hypothetical protein [Lunatibacter salilacus]
MFHPGHSILGGIGGKVPVSYRVTPVPEDIVVENNRKQEMVAEKDPGDAAVEGRKLSLVELVKKIPGGSEK